MSMLYLCFSLFVVFTADITRIDTRICADSLYINTKILPFVVGGSFYAFDFICIYYYTINIRKISTYVK